jgi:hypothetical protein
MLFLVHRLLLPWWWRRYVPPNVISYKSHTVWHPRRRHSSSFILRWYISFRYDLSSYTISGTHCATDRHFHLIAYSLCTSIVHFAVWNQWASSDNHSLRLKADSSDVAGCLKGVGRTRRRPLHCARSLSTDRDGMAVLLTSVPRLTALTLHEWTLLGVRTISEEKLFV